MDFILLIGLMVVAVVIVSVIRVRSQAAATPPEHPRLVTDNLDFSILGQRPEIVTEDDGDERVSS